MIDTIVLTLKQDQFRITHPEKFLPSACWALAQPLKPIPGIRSKQNPTKKELKTGIYKPRLTLMQSYEHRYPELILRIELSLPKLILVTILMNCALLRIKLRRAGYKDFKVALHYLEKLACPSKLAKSVDLDKRSRKQRRPLLLDFKPKGCLPFEAQDERSRDNALLAALIINNPNLSPKRIIQLFGLKKALENTTIRELKELFPKAKQRSWQRLIAEAGEVRLPHALSPFRKIRIEIVKWKACKLNYIKH